MSDEGVVQLVTKDTKVRSILADTLNRADEWDVVVVLVMDKEGNVGIGHSDASLAEKAGMCTFGAHKFAEEARYGT